MKGYEPVWSVPQMTLPEASVSRSPEQVRSVCILSPPPVSTNPLIVEEAEVALSAVV